MGWRSAWLVVAVAATGCFRPSFDGLECSPGGDCPPGLTCELGVCVDPDDAEGEPDPIDAAVPEPDAPPQVEECNPVTQQGCDDDEKCSFVVTRAEEGVAVEGETRCIDAAAAELAEGASCSYATVGTERVDRNCQPGLQCTSLTDGGTCRAICSPISSSCGVEKTCQMIGGLFEDRSSTGLCTPDL